MTVLEEILERWLIEGELGLLREIALIQTLGVYLDGLQEDELTK